MYGVQSDIIKLKHYSRSDRVIRYHNNIIMNKIHDLGGIYIQ